MGIPDVKRLLTLEDLVQSEDVMFVATGITSSFLLKGVRVLSGHAITHTLVMRSTSGTIRLIEADHRMDKKPLFKDDRIKCTME